MTILTVLSFEGFAFAPQVLANLPGPARTKKAFYHQRLAQCLCRTLDMEKVGRKDHSELLPRLVKQVLDITNGIRFPLDANSDESRILEYMDLMEAVAQVHRGFSSYYCHAIYYHCIMSKGF